MKEIHKILELNKTISKKLDIEKLKAYHHNDMLFKICYTVLEPYKSNFKINLKEIDLSLMKKYINSLILFIDEYIIQKKEISRHELLSLHYNILKELTTTEKIHHSLIGNWRNQSKYFPGKKLDGKIIELGLTHPKKIEKEEKELIKNFNEKIQKHDTDKIEAIVKFILINLVLIHPFDNGNGKTFWILLDVLLWKYGFFPTFIQSKTFKPKLLKILSIYNSNKDFDKLINNFYKLMIEIYSNYRV